MSITVEKIIDTYSTYYVVTLCRIGKPSLLLYASTKHEADYLAEIHSNAKFLEQ